MNDKNKNSSYRKFAGEVFVAVVLVILLILIVNPFDIFMPSGMQMAAAAVAVVAFGIFSSFVLREDAGDEREEKHRSLAGRVAFLIGSLVLLIGILVELYRHMLDPWLVVALVSMIIAKIVTRMYSEENL